MRKNFTIVFVFAGIIVFAGCGQNAAEYEIETVLPVAQDERQFTPDEFPEAATPIQALEDFLFPLLSIRTFGDIEYLSGSGGLIYFEFIQTDDEWELVWFDRFGERIDEPEFFNGSLPRYFSLFDLNNDGTPAVLMKYFPLDHGGSGAMLYRFINDEYVVQEGGFFCISSEFFLDRNGRIVVFEHNEYDAFLGNGTTDFSNTPTRIF
jgi:hypothetical protein